VCVLILPWLLLVAFMLDGLWRQLQAAILRLQLPGSLEHVRTQHSAPYRTLLALMYCTVLPCTVVSIWYCCVVLQVGVLLHKVENHLRTHMVHSHTAYDQTTGTVMLTVLKPVDRMGRAR
jgi:hypothetical protein